jgi:uncharacterized membrane-anchored protein
MIHAFRDGGFVMWPMLAAALGIVYLAVVTIIRLRRRDVDVGTVGRSLQSILFWGAISVLLGLLGTVTGMVVASQAISLAGEVDPRLAGGGFSVTLISFVFGLVIFLFAVLLWFPLHHWHSRAVSRAGAA